MSREAKKKQRPLSEYFTRICHATDGPPTNGPAGPSTANFVAIDGPAGLSMAAMDGPAGLSTAPYVVPPSHGWSPTKFLSLDVPRTFNAQLQ